MSGPLLLDIAETLVDGLRASTDSNDRRGRPGGDLAELARHLGVRVRLERGLSEDGSIATSAWSADVRLRAEARLQRRRFTLAHELGHLVLAEPEVMHAAESIATARLDVERLCDAFAAELLMPRRWLLATYQQRDEGFDVLDDLARTAEVSLSAAMTRLCIALHWSSSLVFFSRGQDWTPILIAGPYGRLHGLKLRAGAQAALRGVAHGGPAKVEVLLQDAAGRAVTFTGDGRRSPGGAVCIGLLASPG